MKLEHRLLPLVIGAFLVPIGLIWYGWSAQHHMHWMMPIVGTGFIGVGTLFEYLPIEMYLVVAFGIYAASAVATNRWSDPYLVQNCRYQGGHYTQDLVWGGETVFWRLSLWYFHRCRSCWSNMENGLEPIHGSSQGFDSFSLLFILITAAISEAAWSRLSKRTRDSAMLYWMFKRFGGGWVARKVAGWAW